MFNPFDLTGGPFLALYGALLALAVFASRRASRGTRPGGRAQPVDDPDDLAILSRKPNRLADTVVSRMLVRGVLRPTGKGFESADLARAGSSLEHKILALRAPIALRDIDLATRADARRIEASLIESGQVMPDADFRRLRFRVVAPFVLLFVFGTIKAFVGDARDRPIGFLAALLVVTVVVATVRWAVLDRRTDAGVRAVEMAVRRCERLKVAPTAAEVPAAVALFGPIVLAGSGWAILHDLRRTSDGGGCAVSGGDGSGGDSVDGGGGCGGCGGGD